MKFVLGLMLLAVALVGCGEDDPVSAPHEDNYIGTYMWRDTTVVISAAKIDSVQFRVIDGYLYTLRFYAVDGTDQVDFCDCDGRLAVNTSSLMTFEPTVVIYQGCDSLRVPRGEFIPDYVTHRPDTVYFEKRVDSFLYRLIVVPI